VPAWLLFNVDFLGWHLPRLYELALRHQPVHDLEHASFVLFGVIFWMQVFDSPPLRRSLRGFAQIVYVVTAAMAGWVLALVLTVAVDPIYPSYAAVAGRRTALADQQLAGGIMWIPAMIPFAAALFYFIWRWLAEQELEQAIADAPDGGGGAPVPRPAPPTRRPPRPRDVTHV
jgi:cytochrome c oxidase assembly factor CtaG